MWSAEEGVRSDAWLMSGGGAGGVTGGGGGISRFWEEDKNFAKIENGRKMK